jgi:hypothetical protein
VVSVSSPACASIPLPALSLASSSVALLSLSPTGVIDSPTGVLSPAHVLIPSLTCSHCWSPAGVVVGVIRVVHSRHFSLIFSSFSLFIFYVIFENETENQDENDEENDHFCQMAVPPPPFCKNAHFSLPFSRSIFVVVSSSAPTIIASDHHHQ